jgi:glycosyltransferase involved in cell wall biosynthesis
MRVLLTVINPAPSQLDLWRAVEAQGVDLHIVGTLVPSGRDVTTPLPEVPDFGTFHELQPLRVRNRPELWWALAGLGSLINDLAPEIVHVGAEAWSLLAFQATRSNSAVVIHGADNRFDHGSTVERSFRRIAAEWNLRRSSGYVSWNQRGVVLARAYGLSLSAPTFVAPFIVRREDAFAQAERNPSVPCVAFVGRVTPEKGPDLLLDALVSVTAKWRCMVVGDGPLLPRLREKFRSDHRITFSGALPPHEIPGLLAGVDILVVPSLTTPDWEEQFGRVALEGMHAGAVPVVSSSGALPEVVGDAGLVVPEGDICALRLALETMFADGSLRRELSERGRRRAREKYSPEVLAAGVIDMWERASRTRSAGAT